MSPGSRRPLAGRDSRDDVRRKHRICRNNGDLARGHRDLDKIGLSTFGQGDDEVGSRIYVWRREIAPAIGAVHGERPRRARTACFPEHELGAKPRWQKARGKDGDHVWCRFRATSTRGRSRASTRVNLSVAVRSFDAASSTTSVRGDTSDRRGPPSRAAMTAWQLDNAPPTGLPVLPRRSNGKNPAIRPLSSKSATTTFGRTSETRRANSGVRYRLARPGLQLW